jgi:hypothetical protein
MLISACNADKSVFLTNIDYASRWYAPGPRMVNMKGKATSYVVFREVPGLAVTYFIVARIPY